MTRFCWIALLEGISCVLLFCITMPLKYTLGYGQLSYWAGMAHGVLFILYVLILLQAASAYKWKAKRVGVYFVASLVPFATFWVERHAKRQALARS